MRVAKQIAAWLAWWIALFWLFLLLVGEWNSLEWMAAAAAGLVAAVAAAVVRRLGTLGCGVRLAWLAPVPKVLLQVVVDFGILVRALALALARRRPPRGVFRAVPFEDRGRGEAAAGRRAVLALLATYSPNAYVLDVDAEQGRALVHDLVPRRSSEGPL